MRVCIDEGETFAALCCGHPRWATSADLPLVKPPLLVPSIRETQSPPGRLEKLALKDEASRRVTVIRPTAEFVLAEARKPMLSGGRSHITGIFRGTVLSFSRRRRNTR